MRLGGGSVLFFNCSMSPKPSSRGCGYQALSVCLDLFNKRIFSIHNYWTDFRKVSDRRIDLLDDHLVGNTYFRLFDRWSFKVKKGWECL